MKKIIILISTIFVFTFNSCNSEKKNQKLNDENDNKFIEAPYNISVEGDGQKFNYDTLSIKYTTKAKKVLINRGFKFPDDLTFKNKITKVYKFDIDKYNNKILVLRNAMFPEIVIKTDKYVLVQDEEFESNDFINDEFLFYYNDYIFYNNRASFEILKIKYPESLKDLVTVFGYVKDEKIAKFVLEKYNYKSFEGFKDLIFDKIDNKYKIREDVLDGIIQYSYGGKTKDLSYAKDGDGFSRINNVFEFINNNPNQIINSDRTIAVLFQKELEVGITGDIEEKLNSNASYKDFLVKNNYYGFKRLKDYVDYVYGENPNSFNSEIVYKIQDPDGHTNLRKDKSSTSEIVEKVKAGERVEVLDNTGNWWLIKTKSGNQGYIYKSKVKSE